MILVVVSLLAGCNENEKVEEKERATPVGVGEVKFGNLEGTNKVVGTIVSEKEMNVMPKATGEVIEVKVQKGDKVKKGDVIARLDDTNERSTYKQQQASYRLAKETMDSAEKGVEQAKKSLKEAEKQLTIATKKQNENMTSLNKEIRKWEKAYEQAAKNVAKMKELYEEGKISKQQLDEAMIEENRARQSLEEMKTAKSQGTGDASLASLRASVEQAKAGVESAKASARQAEIGFEQAELALKQAEKLLENTVIKAPASGEIASLNIREGELTGTQGPVAQILSLDQVKVSVSVTPQQLMLFERGDEVEIEVAGIDEKYKGTITYISPMATMSGLFTVEALVENKGHKLLPGMAAAIILSEVLMENSVIVPTKAVLDRSGETSVFIVKEGVAKNVKVEVVRYDTEFTAVTGDLKEGDKVITKGQHLLEDGDLVEIVEEE